MAGARQFVRGARRPVTWAFGPSDASNVISSTSSQLWTVAVADPEHAEEPTIVRTRGSGVLWLQTATAIGDGFEVGIGLCLVTDQAVAAGSASIPRPITNRDWDGWLWHTVEYVNAVTATIADGANAVGALVRYEIDSKAMRKWDQGAESIVGVLEATEFGTATMRHRANTRMLLKSG